MDLISIARHIIADDSDDVKVVTVWRGMTGLKPEEVSAIIDQTPDESGTVEIDKVVTQQEMGWWSTNQRMALTYAVTDPAQGPKGRNQVRYDILLQGEVQVPPDSGDEITHLLRKSDTQVHVVSAFYAIRKGESKERKERMMALIP